MRLTLLRLTALVCFVLAMTSYLSAQTWVSNTTVNLSCNQACTDLLFKIPHIKETSDYLVNGTRYAPYPYTTPAPALVLPCSDQDDKFFDTTFLPFPFCFYGERYTRMAVSTNGLVSFDSLNANRTSNWQLNAGTTIPGVGAGSQVSALPPACNPAAGGVLFPRASIMGVYCDLFPFVGSGYKIETRVEGTAPRRRFITSFSNLQLYNCTSVRLTSQIVLYESSGLVEVFVENKPSCSTNGGLGVIGIQDWSRTKGMTAPGHNTNNGPWTLSNTGYRFTPSGGVSRFQSAQLLAMDGTLLATADTTTTTAGELDLIFPDFCSPAGTTQYRLVTTFSSCDFSGSTFTTEDIITVNLNNNLNATSTSTNTVCGPPSGTITVTVPPGAGIAPYSYVIDGGPPQVSANNTYTFTNVPQGSHTVVVTDAGSGCTSTLTVDILQTGSLTAGTDITPTTCPGLNNGSILVSPTNGVPPYTFTLTPGNIVMNGLTANYPGLAPGTYGIKIKDNGDCEVDGAIVVVVDPGPALVGSLSQTPTSCSGASNGSITASVTSGGTAPYTYVLDGATTQTSATTAVFNGLAAGNHTVTVTDNNGCSTTGPLTITVQAGAVLDVAITELVGTSCVGAINGRATFAPTNGTGPYSFVLDGAITQTGAASASFTGLAAGTHSMVVTDANTCVSNTINFTVTAGTVLTTTATHTDVLCFGQSNGTITVNPPTGAGPFEYSLDGTTWQASPLFTGLAAATHTVYFRETSTGCQNSLQEVVAQPAILAAALNITPVACNGEANGRIAATVTGGTAPFEYSLDGGVNWQSSNTFNVPAGNYTVTVRDNNLCSVSLPAVVMAPALLTASGVTANATCNGGDDGTVTITAAGGNGTYTYSLNGTSFQPSNILNAAPGTYTVTVRDQLGCTVTVPGMVVGLTNDLTYSVPAPVTICEGTSTQLPVVSNALQYAWLPVAGVSNPAIANPDLSPSVTTTYTVTITYGRCSDNVPVTININPAPVADAGPDGFICFGQTYQLQGAGGTRYTWSPSTYLNEVTVNNPVSTPDRTITYSLMVEDADGCRSLTADQVTVDVTPPIKVTTFPADTVVYEGDQFQVLATSVATDYLWSPTTGLNNPAVPNPVITAGATGDVVVYKVTASTMAGCKGEGFVRVAVYKGPDLYVPTGFTPNGDGKNDTFFPFPVGIKQLKYFRVFNRWGQVIYSTTRLNDGWDGRFGGRDQAAGVYVWQVEAISKDGKVITRQGTVTLIR